MPARSCTSLKPTPFSDDMNIVKLLVLLALLMGEGFADSRPTTISVVVLPAAVISMRDSDTVNVQIRSSSGSGAQLWIADSCSVPGPASMAISQSGTYAISLAKLPGTGHTVCLMSAGDGLFESANLPRAVASAIQCVNSECFVL
jgi:hypothetical protein